MMKLVNLSIIDEKTLLRDWENNQRGAITSVDAMKILHPRKCECCGAPLKAAGSQIICEYCGTVYE